jgi:phenylpyruvate tautomerase PptA (4-oxalocrotonate tautomerase family)
MPTRSLGSADQGDALARLSRWLPDGQGRQSAARLQLRQSNATVDITTSPAGDKKLEGRIMPLVYYDIVRGRSRDQIRTLLDSTQAAIVEAFGAPERDRYQVVTEHSADEMIILDHGLGIERSETIVVIHMINRRGKKTRAQKERLYELLAQNLKRDCGLDPADLIISITENESEDWSVGYGKAQFCNGELDPATSHPRK